MLFGMLSLLLAHHHFSQCVFKFAHTHLLLFNFHSLVFDDGLIFFDFSDQSFIHVFFGFLSSSRSTEVPLCFVHLFIRLNDQLRSLFLLCLLAFSHLAHFKQRVNVVSRNCGLIGGGAGGPGDEAVLDTGLAHGSTGIKFVARTFPHQDIQRCLLLARLRAEVDDAMFPFRCPVSKV